MTVASEAPTTKRVELSGEQWAVVRGQNIGDLRHKQIMFHERGYEDPMLTGFDLLQRRIVEWSRGEVTTEAIDALSVDDANLISNAINAIDGDGGPKASSRSSTGTRKSRGSRRPNG